MCACDVERLCPLFSLALSFPVFLSRYVHKLYVRASPVTVCSGACQDDSTKKSYNECMADGRDGI